MLWKVKSNIGFTLKEEMQSIDAGWQLILCSPILLKLYLLSVLTDKILKSFIAYNN